MSNRIIAVESLAIVFLAAFLAAAASAEDGAPDPLQDILVTFVNQGVAAAGSGVSEPYRKRKRYSIGAEVRRHAADIANEYALIEIDRWPIRSLSVFCFIYRVSAETDRDSIIERLRTDPRVESAQALQRFETLASTATDYDDTYANLQRVLDVMEIPAAHRYSRGKGVRIAIVDSHADGEHEDLKGRVTETLFLADSAGTGDVEHGTVIAGAIGANANNAKGIVGIAPESIIELYVACWAESEVLNAVCDSFSLAKALDALLDDGPDILNLSLTGPYDPLLERLLEELDRAGVVMVAARPAQDHQNNRFPASLDRVISVGSSDGPPAAKLIAADSRPPHEVYAPGAQIMVAVPGDGYDFRSGNSLAAAHVSGTIALLLAVSPNMPSDVIQTYLRKSQRTSRAESPSINACIVLQLLDGSRECRGHGSETIKTEVSHSGPVALSRARQY
jgi:subtilisin family serine protease